MSRSVSGSGRHSVGRLGDVVAFDSATVTDPAADEIHGAGNPERHQMQAGRPRRYPAGEELSASLR